MLTCFALVLAREAGQAVSGLYLRNGLFVGGAAGDLGGTFGLGCRCQGAGLTCGLRRCDLGALFDLALDVEALDVVLKLDFAGLIVPGLKLLIKTKNGLRIYLLFSGDRSAFSTPRQSIWTSRAATNLAKG